MHSCLACHQQFAVSPGAGGGAAVSDLTCTAEGPIPRPWEGWVWSGIPSLSAGLRSAVGSEPPPALEAGGLTAGFPRLVAQGPEPGAFDAEPAALAVDTDAAVIADRFAA